MRTVPWKRAHRRRPETWFGAPVSVDADGDAADDHVPDVSSGQREEQLIGPKRRVSRPAGARPPAGSHEALPRGARPGTSPDPPDTAPPAPAPRARIPLLSIVRDRHSYRAMNAIRLRHGPRYCCARPSDPATEPHRIGLQRGPSGPLLGPLNVRHAFAPKVRPRFEPLWQRQETCRQAARRSLNPMDGDGLEPAQAERPRAAIGGVPGMGL